jgi:hypothetical protein
MKKGVLFILILLLIGFSFVSADVNTTQNSNQNSSAVEDSRSQIDKAYDCLLERINKTTCSKLSLEENIFSVLSTGKCEEELVARSKDGECWPKDNCNLKSTAQAVLALNRMGEDVDKPKAWLISQNGTPERVNWYLQIDSNEQTSCKITYDGSSHITNIDSDRRVLSGAGPCLSIESGREWWLRISSTCLDKEFEVSCNTGFSTSLLFRRADSPVFHVSENTHSASPEGTTTEKINSFCFKNSGSCDYEGSLWAALVLDYLGQEVTSYLPYLITMADENTQYLPESFLYGITGYLDFKVELLQRQKVNKYWEESTGRRFYDTALALFNINDEPPEKANSKSWLLEIQGKDGCWDGGNILTNAFLLYSIWPRAVSSSGGTAGPVECEDSGNFCMSSVDCKGEILRNYHCGGALVCCTTQKSLESCFDLGGQKCNPSETRCVGGAMQDSSGLSAGEQCCVGGYCAEPTTIPECEEKGGRCASYCATDEDTSDDECDFDSDVCCVTKTTKGGIGWFWIILLLLLIILVVLAIIFREKLRPYWFRLKSKFSRGTPPASQQFRPRGPPGAPGLMRPKTPFPQRKIIPQRRIFPPTQNKFRPASRTINSSSSEHEDILKKLKEMGGQ